MKYEKAWHIRHKKLKETTEKLQIIKLERKLGQYFICNENIEQIDTFLEESKLIQKETENTNTSKTIKEMEILVEQFLKYEVQIIKQLYHIKHSQKCQFLIYVHIILRQRTEKKTSSFL